MSDIRETTWKFILEKPDDFTIKNLARAASLSHGAVRRYIEGWENAGVLSSWKVGDTRHFKLVEGAPKDAPRVNRAGDPLPERDDDKRIWNTMRRLKTFTAQDIKVTASLPDAPIAIMRAAMCCKWWAEAGYLRDLGANDQGQRSFRFVKDTGPNPPRMLKNISVIDQNGQELSFSKEIGIYS